ncbi:MAG: sigma-70 family RNA polymerase sigma factor [Phycisphaerales bacterium]|nr:MAG: sigma-70 family RNA polymerase sigma factor [Phycisphaerales bacterium]
MLTRTTTAMLDDLADPANEAMWRQFDARYRPVLVAFARRLGLGAEDAADAAQDALTRFLQAFRAGKYQRGRGRLSSWLIGIARNCIVDLQRARMVRREQRGVSALIDLPHDKNLAAIWDAELDREVLRQAVQKLREGTRLDRRTIRVFERLVLQQAAPAVVASELNMTMNDVYLAKHRCLKRLRSIVAELTAAFENDQ